MPVHADADRDHGNGPGASCAVDGSCTPPAMRSWWAWCRQRWRRLQGNESGYTLLDFGFSMLALFGVATIIIQLCLVGHARHLARAAAADVLSIAANYQSSADAGQRDGYAYLRQVAPNLLVSPHITVTRTATTVTVTLHAHVATVVPVSITETVTGPVERLGGVTTSTQSLGRS